MWKVYISILVVVILIAYFWVEGVDYMKENHPDDKGDGFLT